MMRSMFAAISGLKNHQTFMDVVGNNIANVNTTGFKQSRVTFQDILSQTLRGASGPQAGRGGVTGEQIGLGVLVSGIDTIQSQGTLQSTGKSTDMAIQGDGYFVMSDGKQSMYTRDGAFDLALDGTLASASSGLHVLGWQANPLTGVVNTAVPPTNVTVPIGSGMTGKMSTSLTINGNLDSNNLGGAANAVTLSSTVYDAQGNAVPVTWTFTKSAANTWGAVPTTTAPGVTVAGSSTITFNGAGKVATGGAGTLTLTLTNGATSPEPVTVDFSQMTQLEYGRRVGWFADQLHGWPGGRHHWRLLERLQAAVGSDRHGQFLQPERSHQGGRQPVPGVGQLGHGQHRHPGRFGPRIDRDWLPRRLQRRPGPTVHQHDQGRARLPG